MIFQKLSGRKKSFRKDHGLLVVFEEILGDGEGLLLLFEDGGNVDGEVGGVKLY